jgi:hypothetical protein
MPFMFHKNSLHFNNKEIAKETTTYSIQYHRYMCSDVFGFFEFIHGFSLFDFSYSSANDVYGYFVIYEKGKIILNIFQIIVFIFIFKIIKII